MMLFAGLLPVTDQPVRSVGRAEPRPGPPHLSVPATLDAAACAGPASGAADGAEHGAHLGGGGPGSLAGSHHRRPTRHSWTKERRSKPLLT